MTGAAARKVWPRRLAASVLGVAIALGAAELVVRWLRPQPVLLVDRGLAAGALGYVSKLVAGEWLVPAVHAALRGERTVFGVAARGRTS